MRVFIVAFICLLGLGCRSSDYRFERIENGQSILLPLKLIHAYGNREGDSVRAEFDFVAERDSAQIKITLRLRPQAELSSGIYRMLIGGSTFTGSAESNSITFLGGQGGSPSIGGVFELKDNEGRPVFRVRIPLTQIVQR